MKLAIRALAVGLLLGGIGAGCGEDPPTGPEIVGGAGLRVRFPAGTAGLEGVRVELWHDNAIPPADCDTAAGSPRRVRFLPGLQPPDLCTRIRVEIWNYIAEAVRTIPDTTFEGRAHGWDGKDDAGRDLPSGFYPTAQVCLDSQGSFTFTGHYYLWEDREAGACEWPLWIEEEVSVPGDRVLAFGPFPEVAETKLLDDQGRVVATVPFMNPFLVRVHAPGMETFETEVSFTARTYSEVTVTFTPVP